MPILAFVGFFGQQAIRMLRESWEGIVPVSTDPISQQQQVRPVGADLLAQELFSVLNDSTPQTQNAPVTINQAAGAMGLTINSSGSTSDPAVLNVTSGNITLAGTGTVLVGTSSTSTTDGSTVVLQGSNLVIPPIGQLPLAATSYDPLSPTQLPTINLGILGSASPGQAYIGQVKSGTGAGPYQVSLIGINGDVSVTPEVVGVGYNIPVNSWQIVVAADNNSGGVNYLMQPFPFAPFSVGTSGSPLAWQNMGSGGALPTLLTQLDSQGLIVNHTSSQPQSFGGYTAQIGPGGALANFLTAMSNLSMVSLTTDTSVPAAQLVNGVYQNLGSGGFIQNLYACLKNSGIVADGSSPGVSSTPSTVNGSRGGNAALANLLSALAGLGIITDSTGP